ncbi:MAG: ATP-binding protein [Candidatus Helarchaeota archaeon]
MSSKSLKILLIEAKSANKKLIKDFVRWSKENYKLESVNKLFDAIEYLKNTVVDIILLNPTFPDSQGIDTFKRIKKIVPEIPIILIGLDSDTLASNIIKLGAQDYLLKDQFEKHLLEHSITCSVERTQILEKLKKSEARNKAIANLSNTLLDKKSSILDIATIILNNAQSLTKSKHGFVSSIDPETKSNIIHTFSEMIKDECTIPKNQKKIVFPIGKNGKYASLWGHVLNVRKEFYTNSPASHKSSKGIPNGHIILKNFLSAPAIIDGNVMGQIALANSEDDYNDDDLEIVNEMAELYALALQRQRMEKNLKKYSEELEKLVEQRTRELKDTQKELLRKEKLVTIGKLAGVISHELRNPLGVINNSIYYLNMKLKSTDEKVQKHLNILEKEVEKANKIISDILNFTKVSFPVLELKNVNLLIKLTSSNIKYPENIKVILNLDPKIPKIRLDPTKIQQVFYNLINNAVQAMPDGGTLKIESGLKNDFVHVYFKDTGVGIPKENYQKIFEPLFSTKPKGIGLGLPFVKDIIEMHKGSIELESKVGVGTTFVIKLPKKQEG